MRRTLVTASGWTVFIFAVYALLGLRPVPPQTIGEGEICFKCRRVITNAKLAAEIVDGGLPTKYKSAGCMAAYVAQHPSSDSRYYVADFPSGGLIEVKHAYFVPVVVNDKTGERGYRAYYSRGMAEIAAQILRVPVVDWQTIVARAKA